ncbi:MAG TPA: hypothetical protein VD997_08865 [Phycisphaerales bacterium]|nr:hypothetical protein [Phycisphaerales bacterium]
MTFLHSIRRRVLWIAVGVGLTTLGVVSMTTLPAWPIVGAAVATLALVVNSMTRSLRGQVCLGCGQSIANLPHGDYGVICPRCGHVSSSMHLAENHPGPNLSDADEDARA